METKVDSLGRTVPFLPALHLRFFHGVHCDPYELILAPPCVLTLQEDVPAVVNTDKDTEKRLT